MKFNDTPEETTMNTITTPSVDARGCLLLTTTAHPTLFQHTLDGEMHPNLGRLVTPRHFPRIEDTAAAGIPWAADNDCFQELNVERYTRMIDRIAGLEGCLFVTVPDVVGDSEATFRLFDEWIVELEARGLPAALVAQDGLEDELDRVQWDRLAAIFIGGSTEWKEGAGALAVARAARARGKFVHWGRVNTRRRFDLIVAGGVADSFDGSKWARFRKTYLDQGLSWMLETRHPDPTGAPSAAQVSYLEALRAGKDASSLSSTQRAWLAAADFRTVPAGRATDVIRALRALPWAPTPKEDNARVPVSL